MKMDNVHSARLTLSSRHYMKIDSDAEEYNPSGLLFASYFPEYLLWKSH